MADVAAFYAQLKGYVDQTAREQIIASWLAGGPAKAARNLRELLGKAHAEKDGACLLGIVQAALSADFCDPRVLLGDREILEAVQTYACQPPGDVASRAILLLCERAFGCKDEDGPVDVGRILHLAWDIARARGNELDEGELALFRLQLNKVAKLDVSRIVEALGHFEARAGVAVCEPGYKTLYKLKKELHLLGYEKLIGAAVRQRVYNYFAVRADDAGPILLLGTSSSGKGHIVEHVIRNNTDRTGVFRRINSHTLTARQMATYLSEASHGTLFFDEADGLRTKARQDMQDKMLVTMQDPNADVLFVFATSKIDLENPNEMGLRIFIKDMWNRLVVSGPLKVPPFRDRPEDVHDHLAVLASEELIGLSDDLVNHIIDHLQDEGRSELKQAVHALAVAARQDLQKGSITLSEARAISAQVQCDWLRKALQEP